MKKTNKNYSKILVIGSVGRGMSFDTKKMTLAEYLRSSEKDLIIDPENNKELPRVHNISM